MPNDITTLAIEIQSQEAERNLRTFQELLTLSSQTAHKMEKVSIEVNAEQAISQLQTMREVYEGIAAAGKNIAFEMPKMPEITAVPEMSMQSDPEALRALQEFFETSREMSQALREEMEQFSEAMRQIEADTMKVSTAGGRNAGTMRGGATVTREYAAAVRELNAAQREMEKAIVQADEAMKATAAADEDAAAVKKRLTQAQRELASVSKQLADTHNGMGGDIIGLSQKEDMLKNKVAELKIVYEEARGAADKFNLKLEESAAKADAARAKYQEVKARLETMPQNPMGETSESVQTFSEKAKLAGRDITKLTRGISGIASVAGTAIPGISGLGRAISMLGMGNPYLAAAAVAVGACVAVYHEYDNIMKDTAVSAHEMAEAQAKAASEFKKEAQDRQSNLERLAVLNSYENLYDVEKEESRKIVEKLTAAYKDLGIQYDSLTGKVTNLAEVSKRMSEQDRQRLLAEHEEAVKRAKEAAATQLAESQRNSVSWFKNVLTMDYPGGRLPGRGKTAQQQADEWYAYINSAKDLEEQIKRIDEAISKLHDIRQKGSWGQRFLLDAKNFSNELEKSRTALLEYQKRWKILKEIQDSSGVGGGRTQEAISESLRMREEKLRAARNASMTGDEKYEENVSALERLYEKQKEIAALKPQDPYEYNGKNITAAEALLDIETEITNRTRERLAYEKQLEALTAKIESQKRLWNMDDDGNIVSKKNDAERRADRNSRIDELQNEIRELKERVADSDPAQAHILKKDIANAQLELNALQQEKIADAERIKREAELAETAKKRLDEARKAYVIDADGNRIRKKYSNELSAELEKELSAAKQRVDAARNSLKEKEANEQAAVQAERDLATLRKQQAELTSKYNSRKRSLPETGNDPEEEDEELSRIGSDLEKLKERIEEAKKRAEEARKRAVSTGSEAKVSEAEMEVNRLEARKLALKNEIESARRRAEEAKRGLVFDEQGNITGEKDSAGRAEELRKEIEAQREKIAKLAEGSKERFDAEAKLTQLLRQEYSLQKQASDEKKRAEEAKKGFVWDNKGNIVRRKNESELAKERKEEIEAAKAKVAATKAGTKERYEAEAELRRLQTADFNAREKKGGDGSFGMMSNEKKVNSNMVKGVDVNSSEARALQARNFTRGADPEKKVETSLKEIETLIEQIRNTTTDYSNIFKAISEAVQSMNGNFEPV